MALTLKNDVIFKAVFGREAEECKAALVGMLNLILNRKDDPIKSVVYKNPFNVREMDAQKEGILDIKAETDRGELLDIEMQFAEDGEIIERNLYYHCGMVTRGLAAGEKYGTLKKTISISILNYALLRMGGEFHTCHILREKQTGETLTNLMQFHYIELPKVNQDKLPVAALTEVERFLEYLKYAGEPGWEDYVEELRRQGGREIQMTDAIMREVTQEEILREKAIARDKFLHWQASCQRENKKLKGELEEANGKLEETGARLQEMSTQLRHMIQSLAAQGMDMVEIAEITDMEERQVKAYL
ncbi:Rpn family recombination-promoting nuclease/putative transposase [Clostridiales bacterium]|nr:Rpn family recombination-promoting nuclease/putative transposase [Clostridiales bacterium]